MGHWNDGKRGQFYPSISRNIFLAVWDLAVYIDNYFNILKDGNHKLKCQSHAGILLDPLINIPMFYEADCFKAMGVMIGTNVTAPLHKMLHTKSHA